MNKGAEFKLADEEERVAQVHRECCRLSGKVCIEAGERIRAQKVARIVSAVAIVIALHAAFHRQRLVVVDQGIAKQEAPVGCFADILRTACRKRIEHVDCPRLRDRVGGVVLVGDLKARFMDEAGRKNRCVTELQIVLLQRQVRCLFGKRELADTHIGSGIRRVIQIEIKRVVLSHGELPSAAEVFSQVRLSNGGIKRSISC